MVNVMPELSSRCPQRTGKPRRHGITHVLDKGLPAVETARRPRRLRRRTSTSGSSAGAPPTSTPDSPEKLALLAEHGVLACTGGTLLEVAWQQGVVEEYLDWAAAVGFPLRRGVLRGRVR